MPRHLQVGMSVPTDHLMSKRLFTAWVTRFRCRYLDTYPIYSGMISKLQFCFFLEEIASYQGFTSCFGTFRYLFACNRWFAEDQEDGRTDRILRLTSKESIESGIILRSNLNRKFYEDHLWLSIIFRRCRSTYTRVQRVSTAWALLFLTMISNAMWFKDASDTVTNVVFSIGPISLTTYQLYASVVSSLTVVPAVLIITYCYVKACPKSEETICVETYSEAKRLSSPQVTEDDDFYDDLYDDLFIETESMDSEASLAKDIPQGVTKQRIVRKRPKGRLFTSKTLQHLSQDILILIMLHYRFSFDPWH